MLVVVVAGCGARSGRVGSAAVADAQTAVRVKTALVNDAVLGTLPIDVRAEAGVVTLHGNVNSAGEVDLALALVRGVAGVVRVESALTVGVSDGTVDDRRRRTRPADRTVATRPRLPALAPRPEEGPLRIVGLGASVRVTRPSETGLARSLVVGPLLRLRPRNGLGPTVAFNWTNTGIETGPEGRPGLAAIGLRPVMGGVEVGKARGRFWAGASIVAGYSFNKLSIDTARVGTGPGHRRREQLRLAPRGRDLAGRYAARRDQRVRAGTCSRARRSRSRATRRSRPSGSMRVRPS